MFVIIDPSTSMYFVGGKIPRWDKDINKASSFKSEEAAFNVIDNNKVYLDWLGSLRYQIQVICDGKDNNGREVIPLAKEEAEEVFEALDNAVKNLISIIDKLPSLQKFYAKEEERFCGIQQDMLHKIEFDDIRGLQAVLFMKEMREMRRKRRVVKDRRAIVERIISCDLKSLVSRMTKKYDSLEERIYTPREMPELFENK